MGFTPFSGEDEEEICRNVLMKNIDDSFKNVKSEEIISFFNGLFQEKPKERLGMPLTSLGNIKQHSFFGQNFKWAPIEHGNNFDAISMVKIDARPLPKLVLNSNEISKLLPSIDGKLLKTMDQNVFSGFDFVDEGFF